MQIDLIKPYPKNAKKHPKAQIEQIANSIKEFGFNQPLVVDKDGVIIVGHGRYEAAKLLGLKDVPVVEVDLDENQAKAYRLADNRLNETDWDMALVIEELKQLEGAGFDISLTGFDLNGDLLADTYTKTIKSPVYEMKGENPSLYELFDSSKTDELIKEIENAGIAEEIKEFLIKAAYRHCVFDYQKIAEFYARSSKDVQDLMEKSALVVIDYNKAIENGFVKLTEYLMDVQSHEA